MAVIDMQRRLTGIRVFSDNLYQSWIYTAYVYVVDILLFSMACP
uniref:Uncharacterized protein n=1 Tax=Candidatus Kentrum sp. FW TaxID=2126338 RepID=A0A450TIE7_9GAMM|nr:MAG: hypothetical protein BECKFW1821B_GA0114236_11263 [Candidatus Kentron sp. FW]